MPFFQNDIARLAASKNVCVKRGPQQQGAPRHGYGVQRTYWGARPEHASVARRRRPHVPNRGSDSQALQLGGAPMKHPSIRELFDYWNERRGKRIAPERADIEPEAIRRALADTFMLSFDSSLRHPFRIAGTRVCALFRRELKGEGFLDLWSVTSRNDIRDILDSVADQSVGVVAGVAAAGVTDAELSFELLLLPLSHCARPSARLLGALVPSEPPLWLGTRTLSDLVVLTHRYVGPAAVGKIQPRGPVTSRGRLQHGFVVYDGGHDPGGNATPERNVDFGACTGSRDADRRRPS
jgi:hypothetical protein